MAKMVQDLWWQWPQLLLPMPWNWGIQRDDDHTQDNKYQIQGDHGSQSAADRLLHHEQNNSDDEIERAGGNMDITA
ncbi:hypothetical protein QQP08_004543 [Theobroma cacao]|nr:hypothetical protein QQP08_004543 [Theobroma cacao]